MADGTTSVMLLSDFDYVLPDELIAQEPVAQRDESRLLVVHKDSGALEHRRFFEILDFIRDDDLLVFNDTRVMPARLDALKQTGGKVEVLLTRRLAPGRWRAMVKPGRRIAVGVHIVFADGLSAEVVERTPDGGRVLDFTPQDGLDDRLAMLGSVPLPPYIHKRIEDSERYQTVYARVEGSAAAPTAGLHFTGDLLDRIRARGVKTANVTLHVGIATFRPVRCEIIEDHEMHDEWLEVDQECVDAVNGARGRVVAIGTTTARALESAAVSQGRVEPFVGETKLFITPGYRYNIVDALITNFHMPRSSLLMLVSALVGTELLKAAYIEAIRDRYRFLSFGDAMFIC